MRHAHYFPVTFAVILTLSSRMAAQEIVADDARSDALFVRTVAPPGLATPPGAAFFQVNRNYFEQWAPDDGRSVIVSNFPLDRTTRVTLRLRSFPVLTADAKVVAGTAHGDVPFEPMKHVFLSGTIDGDATSHVYLALFPTYAVGYIERWSGGTKQTYLISPLAGDIYSTQTLIVYADTDVHRRHVWNCGSEWLEFQRSHGSPLRVPKPNPAPHGSQNGARIQSTTPLAITDALDCSHNFYTDRGSSDSNKAVNYALVVFGAVSDIYRRDVNVSVLVPYCRVWTVTDPYTTSTKDSQLVQFRSYWNTNQQSVVRSAAHLLSGTNYGGIAWIDVLCQSNSTGDGFAVSGLVGGYVYPNDGYYFDVNCTSHEFGHNVGSLHTHDCSWNPAIDSCAAAEGGTCFPSSAIHGSHGTIMSYCYTTSAGMDLVFHPKVAALLRSKAEAASCAASVSMPQAHAGSDQSVCRGTGVTIGQTATGGTTPITYWWRPATGLSDTTSATPTATPASTTTYIVRATDALALRTYDTVIVSVYPSVTLGHTPTHFVCPGTSATIGQTATGGTTPFTYSWSPATGLSNPSIAAPTATPAATTSYIETATDAHGCVRRDTTLVSVYTPPTLAHTPNATECLGSNVMIGHTAAAGTSPYTYQWTPPAGLNNPSIATPLASPPATTTFVEMVTDANGCIARDTVLVTVPPLPSIAHTPSTGVCPGSGTTIGQAATGGTAPFTYSWSPTAGLSNPTIATPVASPAATTNYIETVTDANGCVARDTVIVNAYTPPSLVHTPNSTVCLGTGVTIGQIATGGAPPYTYLWAPVAGLSNSTLASPLASPSTSTTYVETVTDVHGCTRRDTATVTVAIPPTLAHTPTSIVCVGTSIGIGQMASGGTPPYSYSWSPASGLSDPSIPSPVASPAAATAYVETVMDAKGCMARDSAIVNVYPVLLLAHTPDALVCAGTPTAIGQNATGGTAPLLYAWSPPNGLSSTSVAMPSATPASSTTYVETVTDANGCKARDTVFVTVAPSLTFSLGADQTVCAGSDVLLSPQGAIPSDANYVWKNLTTGATEGATRNITVRADSNSTHELRIVSGSCLARDTVQITVHPNPLATISVSADTLIASAGSSYQWAMDTTTIRGATSRTLVPHATGSYSVEVFDAFGCHSRSASVDVKELGVSAQQLATSIRIVPNPTHGIVTAFLPEGEHCLSAYASAILGQRWPLELRTRGENGWQIDLRTLAPGSYFLHVVTSAGEHLVKVIRE